MIESRCGLLCSKCKYQKQMNCQGCVCIKEPFWGEECPVKICCEEQGKMNCGQCPQFPCHLLKQFAFDEKQGDDGKRIQQCQKWCRE